MEVALAPPFLQGVHPHPDDDVEEAEHQAEQMGHVGDTIADEESAHQLNHKVEHDQQRSRDRDETEDVDHSPGIKDAEEHKQRINRTR